MVKNLPAFQETWVQSLGGEGNGNPLQSGKFHGQRSLEGCSPQGHKNQTRLSDYTITSILLKHGPYLSSVSKTNKSTFEVFPTFVL